MKNRRNGSKNSESRNNLNSWKRETSHDFADRNQPRQEAQQMRLSYPHESHKEKKIIPIHSRETETNWTARGTVTPIFGNHERTWPLVGSYLRGELFLKTHNPGLPQQHALFIEMQRHSTVCAPQNALERHAISPKQRLFCSRRPNRIADEVTFASIRRTEGKAQSR